VSQTSEVLNKIEQLAAQCGIEGEHDLEKQFVICFGLPEDRTQEVCVTESNSEPGVEVVTLHSVCLVVDKGLFKGISKSMALELLILNETLNFARYGIQEDDESYVIVASYDLMLDSLDPKGLEAALECVALAADGYEAKFDQDVH
jgi:hypothetical protein